jgi:bacterioferritin-associated ferredoxin
MVNRCICHNVPFTTIAEQARQGRSIAEISAATNCGMGCGLCRPYVWVVVTTGATNIPVLSPSQAAQLSAKVDAILPRAKGKKQP